MHLTAHEIPIACRSAPAENMWPRPQVTLYPLLDAGIPIIPKNPICSVTAQAPTVQLGIQNNSIVSQILFVQQQPQQEKHPLQPPRPPNGLSFLKPTMEAVVLCRKAGLQIGTAQQLVTANLSSSSKMQMKEKELEVLAKVQNYKINKFLPKGWNAKLAMRMSGREKNTFTLSLFSPDNTRIRSRIRLKEFCEAKKIDFNLFNQIKFFYNPIYLDKPNVKEFAAASATEMLTKLRAKKRLLLKKSGSGNPGKNSGNPEIRKQKSGNLETKSAVQTTKFQVQSVVDDLKCDLEVENLTRNNSVILKSGNILSVSNPEPGLFIQDLVKDPSDPSDPNDPSDPSDTQCDLDNDLQWFKLISYNLPLPEVVKSPDEVLEEFRRNFPRPGKPMPKLSQVTADVKTVDSSVFKAKCHSKMAPKLKMPTLVKLGSTCQQYLTQLEANSPNSSHVITISTRFGLPSICSSQLAPNILAPNSKVTKSMTSNDIKLVDPKFDITGLDTVYGNINARLTGKVSELPEVDMEVDYYPEEALDDEMRHNRAAFIAFRYVI